ncbi:flagellar basal body rod protein FlgB [Natronincola ferrireducens]|uniref:Flagellar basal body rod protein FlgB n=1 Tax=Natronincola ferrireducens TaxID=393762 RepID=A0A1G9C081_9FIRM|nr:flagellar basal body rod protein FlgB [Natronincola ferrireducens]SDK45070.1 flagellar basal-body rod protein FlgB [Natronincola ferrireducens]
MMSMFQNIDIMTKSLNASWKRNEVIANNIANVNTPNYKKSHVVFEELLKDYLNGSSISGRKTHESHIDIGITDMKNLRHKTITPGNYQTRRDGNNVDIDVEMAALAKNNITFNTLSTQLNNDLRRLKLAINEGRR